MESFKSSLLLIIILFSISCCPESGNEIIPIDCDFDSTGQISIINETENQIQVFVPNVVISEQGIIHELVFGLSVYNFMGNEILLSDYEVSGVYTEVFDSNGDLIHQSIDYQYLEDESKCMDVYSVWDLSFDHTYYRGHFTFNISINLRGGAIINLRTYQALAINCGDFLACENDSDSCNISDCRYAVYRARYYCFNQIPENPFDFKDCE